MERHQQLSKIQGRMEHIGKSAFRIARDDGASPRPQPK